MKAKKVKSDEFSTERRILQFLQIMCSADSVSKAEIQSQLNLKNTAFYRHLKNLRKIFKIETVGSIGGNAYYSIDKISLANYFNIKHHHTSSS